MDDSINKLNNPSMEEQLRKFLENKRNKKGVFYPTFYKKDSRALRGIFKDVSIHIFLKYLDSGSFDEMEMHGKKCFEFYGLGYSSEKLDDLFIIFENVKYGYRVLVRPSLTMKENPYLFEFDQSFAFTGMHHLDYGEIGSRSLEISFRYFKKHISIVSTQFDQDGLLKDFFVYLQGNSINIIISIGE